LYFQANVNGSTVGSAAYFQASTSGPTLNTYAVSVSNITANGVGTSITNATTLSATTVGATTVTGTNVTANNYLNLYDFTNDTGNYKFRAYDSAVISADRTLTFDLVNADRTLKFGGDLTLAGSVTHAGAFARTFTATGTTNITLPTTGTLATLAGTEALSNKTITASAFNGTVGATTPSTGAFTTLTGTGLLQVAAAGRFTGNSLAGATGAAVELLHNGTVGTISSYNRTGAAYTALNIDALSTNLQVSGTTVAAVSSGGLAVTGTINATGVYKANGTSGISGTMTTASLAGKTLTFSNGIITGFA
jgi:hypothetical protein